MTNLNLPAFYSPISPTRPQLPAVGGGDLTAATRQERVRISVEVDCFHNLTLFRGVVSGLGRDTIYLMTHRRLTAGEFLRIVLPYADGRRSGRLFLTCRIRTVEVSSQRGPVGMDLDVLRVDGEPEPGLYRRYLCSLGVTVER